MEISTPRHHDIIPVLPDTTIPSMFRERVARSPQRLAYKQFNTEKNRWQDYTWSRTSADVARWQHMLECFDLQPGDRIAIMSANRREWSLFDLAGLSLGLVIVPLYVNDRGENSAYILQHSGSRLLLVEGPEQWQELSPYREEFVSVETVLSLQSTDDPAVQWVDDLLPDSPPRLLDNENGPNELATLVYTSGTTGRPKGVMLSHQNILSNASAGLQMVAAYPDDLLLSFLPLSHMLERMAGYYLPMLAGSGIAYSRGIPMLAEDLVQIKPTIMFSVPRVYERVFAKLQDQLEQKSPIARKLFEFAVDTGWHRFEYLQERAPWRPGLLLWPLFNKLVASKLQEKLGGRLRVAITGGAAMTPCVNKLFIGLHVPLLQGYGLTETSPLISVNTFESNRPDSVGLPIPGIEVKLGEYDELLTRGPNVMLGYWNDAEATDALIDKDGWLHTGDQARLEHGHIYITGRIKDVIVLSTGEKIAPSDMEGIAANDPLFDQVMIIGEGKPYLSALVVLNRDRWKKISEKHHLNGNDVPHEAVERLLLKHLAQRLHAFPGYARIRRAWISKEPWDINNGLMTPTMKLKRKAVVDHHQDVIKELYAGH